MIYHVLPGDAQVEAFKKTGIEGEIIVCREALIAGPIDAASLDEFWDARARSMLADYGEDEIVFHERVADELLKLTEMSADDEVNLWFEYELFCSVNYWFCLSLLGGTNAKILRVEPIGLDEKNIWAGFGNFTSDQLKASFELRTELGFNDVELGGELWDAYRHKQYSTLRALSAEERLAFPYLNKIVSAAEIEDIRPIEIVRELIAEGKKDIDTVFPEFSLRAPEYGYGDLQVERLIEKLDI